MWTSRNIGDARGFTLLEVVVAIGILALTFVVLLGLQHRDVELQDYAERLTVATLLARERMMQFEIGPFPSTGEQAGEFLAEHQGYTWRATVTSTPFAFVREVKVRVRWPRDEQGAELTAYVFKTS